jgi:hypothetical protein
MSSTVYTPPAVTVPTMQFQPYNHTPREDLFSHDLAFGPARCLIIHGHAASRYSTRLGFALAYLSD